MTTCRVVKTEISTPGAEEANYTGWSRAPVDFRLERDETHLWLARIDRADTAELMQVISDDERRRAARFRLEPDKKRFVTARGVLRILLGKYLETDCREIRFGSGKYGKPFVSGDCATSIKFNISHSDNYALFAFTLNREIGVDIESIKSSVIDEGMLDYCLTAREIEYFRTLSESKRTAFFFDCWTLKEAYLKACGTGLSVSANSIETASMAGFSPNLSGNNSGRIQCFQNLPAIAGYAAAVAVTGNCSQFHFRQYSFIQQAA